MEKSNQLPPNVQAFALLGGMFNTQVIGALGKFNIFETIGQGAQSVDEIAASCNVNNNALSRTLRFAEFIGLVKLSENKYSLTDVGKYFLKETPGSLAGSMSFITAPPWRDSWNNFSHCLQTGEPAFDSVFHQPFFDFLDKNQEYGKPFNHYQTMLTTMIAPAVVEAYDFSVFKTICDVGGGQGLVLKSILEKNPSCNGILFDLESAMKDHELGETINRTKLISGNFFETIPNADCMILKTVIHDWNDEKSISILSNCRKALNKGGKIILIEQVIEEPYSLMGLFYDLHMLVMLGGAERTAAEFENLFKAARLKLNRIISTKSPMKIIEATLPD